jgi:hypothetical protein
MLTPLDSRFRHQRRELPASDTRAAELVTNIEQTRLALVGLGRRLRGAMQHGLEARARGTDAVNRCSGRFDCHFDAVDGSAFAHICFFAGVEGVDVCVAGLLFWPASLW